MILPEDMGHAVLSHLYYRRSTAESRKAFEQKLLAIAAGELPVVWLSDPCSAYFRRSDVLAAKVLKTWAAGQGVTLHAGGSTRGYRFDQRGIVRGTDYLTVRHGEEADNVPGHTWVSHPWGMPKHHWQASPVARMPDFASYYYSHLKPAGMYFDGTDGRGNSLPVFNEPRLPYTLKYDDDGRITAGFLEMDLAAEDYTRYQAYYVAELMTNPELPYTFWGATGTKHARNATDSNFRTETLPDGSCQFVDFRDLPCPRTKATYRNLFTHLDHGYELTQPLSQEQLGTGTGTHCASPRVREYIWFKRYIDFTVQVRQFERIILASRPNATPFKIVGTLLTDRGAGLRISGGVVNYLGWSYCTDRVHAYVDACDIVYIEKQAPESYDNGWNKLRASVLDRSGEVGKTIIAE